MIARDIEKIVNRLKKEFRVVALVGPRQSRKTTLLKNILPDYAYYNLEDLLTKDEISADPMRFVRVNSRVIIDEV
ncbi:AAA family ATPase, partial [Candidatus Saccharibacteria bacterium]|nr:AAA family ATPase [Candidatus Saccharibacteria bacterium]